MSDWVDLRTYAENMVDDMINAEPDPTIRAELGDHRAEFVDQAEAFLLRQVEQQQQKLH